METPLIDTIKKALSENPEAQDIVEGFRDEWKAQIEDAFIAGMSQYCGEHRCINAEDYLKLQFQNA